LIDLSKRFLYYLYMLDIVTLGAEVLREDAEPIRDIDEETESLAEAMLTAMRLGNGIGLAGPQVGLASQIFVCQIPNDEARVFINPQLIFTSQDQLPYEEGCLSIPGVYSDVVRPAAVTVQALSVSGKPFRVDAEGLLARVIQHEIDHLKGVLFIDHLGEFQREKLLKLYYKKRRK
jgi:peptide deformylase